MARPPPLKRSAVPLRWSAVRNILYRECLAQRENEKQRRALTARALLAFSFRTPRVKRRGGRTICARHACLRARAKFFFFFFFNRRFPWFTLFFCSLARSLACLRCSFACEERVFLLSLKALEGGRRSTLRARTQVHVLSFSLSRAAAAAVTRLRCSLARPAPLRRGFSRAFGEQPFRFLHL